ncbi:NCA2-domain-containing protein [Auricularia subglabra TFB-10046 SS5]|nr:NCA2-domain-containing protein [Auricularia subglabra TFB-10046 SS5]
MSSFVQHHTQRLLLLARPRSPEGTVAVQHADTPRKRQLSEVYAELSAQGKPPASKREQIASLGEVAQPDDGDVARAAYAAATITTYQDAMELVLQQAREAEDELAWWDELQASRWETLLFFVSMLPVRLKRAAETVVQTLLREGIPLADALRNPRSILALVRNTLGPTALRSAAYPRAPRHLPLSASPLALARAEADAHRRALEAVRNERAELLGVLAAMRGAFDPAAPMPFAEALKNAFVLEKAPAAPRAGGGRARAMSLAPPTLPSTLRKLALVVFPAHQSAHADALEDLKRPSALVRAWPRLLLVPPLVWAGVHYAAGLRLGLRDAVETIKGFWSGYVVAPVKDILDTVRTGGEDGVRIVTPEGLKADMESLTRMAESLARDKLGYTEPQLAELAEQVRAGDLGPVLRVYESELQTPLRSALGGSLVRALLIQVQKTKVDLDVAMAGIDRLLRSQELTFAFVGVAPSLAVLYALGGWLMRSWSGTRGRGRYGGPQKRAEAFLAIRRVERLLLTTPGSKHELAPLTQGLVLLSLHQLRTFGDACLPKGSRLRAGFLQDVEDLESTDAHIDRTEKVAVVHRMWRCWGGVLGWGSVH